MRYFATVILWCISASAQTPVPAPAAESSPSVKPKDKCSIEGTVVSSVAGEPGHDRLDKIRVRRRRLAASLLRIDASQRRHARY